MKIILLLAIILSAITPAEAMTEYFSFGRGKKPLVIIPGLSVQSILLFKDIIKSSYEIFSEDFTVYVIDRKKNVPATYSIHEMAEDTAQFMNELRIRDAYVFGASQGGMIAMEIAINHPELVRCMILGSTAAAATTTTRASIPLSHSETASDTASGAASETSGTGETETAEAVIGTGVIDKWIKLAEAGSAASLFQSFWEYLYNQKMDEAAAREAAKSITTEELKRFIVLAKAIKGFNILGELKKIQCPVLVIGSKDDRVLGSKASLLIANQIPHSELFMYEGYGHAAYDTAPDYRERMKRFFDEN